MIHPTPWTLHQGSSSVGYHDANNIRVSFAEVHREIAHAMNWHDRLCNNLKAAITFINDAGFKERLELMLQQIEQERPK